MPLGNGVALASRFLFKLFKNASLSSMTSKRRVSCCLMLLTKLLGLVASLSSSLACLTLLLSSSMILSVLLLKCDFLALSSSCLLKSLIVWLRSNALLMWYFNAAPAVASFKAFGNFTPKMRSGAFLYSVPSVNLVHWYFNAPPKVVARPWLKFFVVAGFRLSAILASFLKSL